MLEYIKGKIQDILEDRIIVDVNGFGMGINFYSNKNSPSIGDDIALYTYLSITQNGVDLYGFREKEEKKLFRSIIKVPNVGPKTAFSLMSGLGLKGLKKALSNNDPQSISRVKGIGKKTAKRIILELKDKLELEPKIECQEARKALIRLGFSPSEADKSINEILQQTEDLSPDEIVERVLKGT